VFVLEVSIKLSYNISLAALAGIKKIPKQKRLSAKQKSRTKKTENKSQKVQRKSPHKKNN
jgi:hypothetical protein